MSCDVHCPRHGTFFGRLGGALEAPRECPNSLSQHKNSVLPGRRIFYKFGRSVPTRTVNRLFVDAPGKLRRSAAVATLLTVGEWLNPNDKISSSNLVFDLLMQDDGNLGIYSVRGVRTPIWASNTIGHVGAKAVFQDDGNFVVYARDGKQPLWASNTTGNSGASAALTDDGELTIGDPSGAQPVWESGSLADRASTVSGEVQQAAGQAAETMKGVFSKITGKP
jgi:hypothetical protein